MSGFADLHIHSTISDGLLTPKQVVDWGMKKGLKCISLTDHDTVGGIETAVFYAQNKDIEIVPGIEISTELQNMEIHILGYFVDYCDSKLNEFLKKINENRYYRAKEMVQKLINVGCRVNFEDVCKIADNALSIGRPHIARVLVNMGICESIEDAFERYIGFGKPAYVERYKISPYQAAEIIVNCGGVAVLAHPGLIPNANIETLAGKLKTWGLSGIEVYHTKHNEKDIIRLKEIAVKLSLVQTGGSDCHGTIINGEPILGNTVVPYSNVMELKEHAHFSER